MTAGGPLLEAFIGLARSAIANDPTSRPRRIQRQRAKGWRMPGGAVYVGRPTIYGNPVKVGETLTIGSNGAPLLVESQEFAVSLYRRWMIDVLSTHRGYLDALRGHDLACWCPLDQPCHADVLLELANG